MVYTYIWVNLMEIIDAKWEYRNLGMTVQEISFDENDTVDNSFESIRYLKAQYQVAKVKADNTEVLYMLQKNGFVYIEDQIHVLHNLQKVERNRLHQRMQDSVTYHKMDNNELDELYMEINEGMFDTDRIALDDKFGKSISAKRYNNWIKDMVEEGITPYALIYKDSVCAFVVLKEVDKGIFDSVLGGYYKAYRNTGLGIVEKEMDIVSAMGGKKIYSSVSSNNPTQLRAMCINGYIPVGINHVLVKHVQ